MSRYIDRDVFLKKIDHFSLSHGTTLGKHSGVADEIIDILMAQPTADVVKVVRCRDCKWWEPMCNESSWMNGHRTDGSCAVLIHRCLADRYLTEQDHFCSHGERRTE